MKQNELDLYTDYLMVTFGQATATGLSSMLDGQVSHDTITRFLSQPELGSKALWQQVKPTVRESQSESGVLIIDDTIQVKPYMDENELVCWHYDHSQGRPVKGINLLNGLYHAQELTVPVAFELIRKPIQYCDVDTRREKRLSEVSKNEQLRTMLDTCQHNQIPFQWVLADRWFSSSEHLIHIQQRHHKGERSNQGF